MLTKEMVLDYIFSIPLGNFSWFLKVKDVPETNRIGVFIQGKVSEVYITVSEQDPWKDRIREAIFCAIVLETHDDMCFLDRHFAE